jgi:SpoVK/Ycf46/Vps4 family AAA+-type ATPase
LDLPGCKEFLFESIKTFYTENKTKIVRKSSTIDNKLSKEKSDKEKDDIKIEVEVEVEEENGMCVSENDIMILSDRIAEQCVGYTGAELKMIIKKAIKYYYHDTNEQEKENERKSNKKIENKNESNNEMENLSTNNNQNNVQNKLQLKHFEKAILDVKRSVTLSDIQEFEKWAKEKK